MNEPDLNGRVTRLEEEVANLRNEVRRGRMATSGSSPRTWILWLVLVLSFFSFYSIFSRQRPSPAPQQSRPASPR